MRLSMSLKTRMILVIALSSTFFVVELAAGLYTRSVALIADAFHYFNDLIGFAVALAALVVCGHTIPLEILFSVVQVHERTDYPPNFSFGWQRAKLLGAFFNGVLLLALGLSVLLQSCERYIERPDIVHPMLVMIIGCIGLTLNLICASILHTHHERGSDPRQCTDEAFIASLAYTHAEHKHELHRPGRLAQHQHDVGVIGILLHILGDAINNLGVITAGAVMWRVENKTKYYVDPVIGTMIGLVILVSGIPLVKVTGRILLQTAPTHLDLAEVQQDLEKIPGITNVHELHIWQLDQYKTVGSVHVAVAGNTFSEYERLRTTLNECFHAYGVHSVTIQAEWNPSGGVHTSMDLYGDQQAGLCNFSCSDEKCQASRCCE